MASPSGYEPFLPQAPTPVVVVSPQFCAPDVVPPTVTKKVASLSGGDFTVTDPSGAVVLQFKGSVWSVRNRRVLLDAAGGDSSSASDLLFTVKRSTLLQLRTEMDFDRNCAFYLGDSDTMIAQISRKYTASNVLLGKDTFNVSVFPGVDHVFVAALVVVLDEPVDLSESSQTTPAPNASAFLVQAAMVQALHLPNSCCHLTHGQ
ncbi:protein LURP-one-related 15 [Panicum miliaceum]|uniref:Protein LURP-one-related 15 n=1 Tax=Panicum miliaceum TaxID=4540 RepID=A0A3L6QTY9_PANMI|nr:protein LURP-one-related 15 [Panicum miliaceum]